MMELELLKFGFELLALEYGGAPWTEGEEVIGHRFVFRYPGGLLEDSKLSFTHPRWAIRCAAAFAADTGIELEFWRAEEAPVQTRPIAGYLTAD